MGTDVLSIADYDYVVDPVIKNYADYGFRGVEKNVRGEELKELV
jgi:hypothetical protein